MDRRLILVRREYKTLCYLTMVEQINLLEHPGPAVSGNFLDDLDGVLHLGVDVDAGLHRGVGALAKHLAGKTVEFVECV